MKPTTEGSNAINFDIVCMSFGKEKERGLKLVQGAEKNSLFNEEMIIKAENSELRKDNKLQLANGEIINFEEKAFVTIKQNRKDRKTKHKKATKTDRDIR